jgi:hypothetical protein
VGSIQLAAPQAARQAVKVLSNTYKWGHNNLHSTDSIPDKWDLKRSTRMGPDAPGTTVVERLRHSISSCKFLSPVIVVKKSDPKFLSGPGPVLH